MLFSRHATNKGNIARHCKIKNNGLVNKGETNEKCKSKVEEIRDQQKKMWVKKDDSNM